ncbi:MAG: efflux RND transporter periplasmic adaptor subunit [Candidatus Levybacteria bacterium]|nr:efflux RND transporter periplasmic adaptor subunit [Candidatus Levybacteria bacterium]
MLSTVFGYVKKPFGWFWNLKKRYKAVVIIILLIGGGIISSQISSATKKPEYITAEAKKTNITEIVSEAGTITINGQTDVYSPTNGIVEEVLVQNGETVKVGQELFKIKSSATETEKSAALATYLAAKSTLDTANASLYSLQSSMFSQWDTFRQLAESDSYENSDGSPKNDTRALPQYHIAEKDWLAAEQNYKKQQAVISQAQTALNTANLTYQATQNAIVKANAAGVIANLSVKQDSTVKAYAPTAVSLPLATIATLATPEVMVQLSENDIAKVEPGQSVTIDVSAISTKIYKGVVSRVDSIGTLDKGVIRYKVYIDVLDADNRLRPGMNVDVEIITTKLSNVLSVPNAAVKPYQGGRAVRVPGKKKGEIDYKAVKVGIKGESRTQILSGIEEGQQVITSLSNDATTRPGPFGG